MAQTSNKAVVEVHLSPTIHNHVFMRYFLFLVLLGRYFFAYNKLLNFVPATKKRGLHGTAYTTLRQPISNALVFSGDTQVEFYIHK